MRQNYILKVDELLVYDYTHLQSDKIFKLSRDVVKFIGVFLIQCMPILENAFNENLHPEVLVSGLSTKNGGMVPLRVLRPIVIATI